MAHGPHGNPLDLTGPMGPTSLVCMGPISGAGWWLAPRLHIISIQICRLVRIFTMVTGLSFKVDTDRNPKSNLLLPTSTSSLQDLCASRGEIHAYVLQLANMCQTNSEHVYI